MKYDFAVIGDTGMPTSIIAQMIYKGEISKLGSYSSEDIVPPEQFFYELHRRKMNVYENRKIINAKHKFE